MTDYKNLIKRLRAHNGWALNDTLDEAADALEELSMKLHGDEAAIAGMKREIERMVLAGKPRWIPVTERLPKDCTPVQVCYIGYNSKEIDSDLLACRYEGLWCYWDGEPCSYDPCQVEITHWMPLPKPPKEGADV